MRFYLSYDTKSTLRSGFWHENSKILPNICDVIVGVYT